VSRKPKRFGYFHPDADIFIIVAFEMISFFVVMALASWAIVEIYKCLAG
jgi:hypothetical protein